MGPHGIASAGPRLTRMDPSSPVSAYQALGSVWIVPLIVALCGLGVVTGMLLIDAVYIHRS